MQADIAFYGSAQMLKFKNDFTKNLSLQMNPKGAYSLHWFISQKSLTFYLFFKGFSKFTLCSKNGSEKQIRYLLEV